MPVTAKLSKAFYERFGEQIANDLVDWFNAVDATYRNDLRELNAQNFALFDAKLEQRLAELHAVIRQEIADLRAELRASIAEIRLEIRTTENRLLRWMFASWVTTIGTMVALLRLWG